MRFLLLILLSVVGRWGSDGLEGRHGGLRPALYAAVYINKGSTSVGLLSSIGLFRRYEGDTVWVNLRPNTITPGVGFSLIGDRHRLFLAGGNGLHRSTDGGATWKILTGWRTKEVLSVAADPVDSNKLYISTPFGVYRSSDGGVSWVEAMKGFQTWYVRRVIIDRDDHSILYATGEDALYRSADRGASWHQLQVGVPGIKWVLQHPVRTDVLLVGTEDHGVLYSNDRGATWLQAGGLNASAVYSITSSADGNTLYAVGFQTGVWSSTDMGSTWVQLWTGPGTDALYSICVNPRNAHHLMVGSNGDGVFESFDQGRTWSHAGLPTAVVRQVAMYP